MPHDRLQKIARAAIMKEVGVAIDDTCKADTPERRCAPLPSRRKKIGTSVGKSISHIVKQEVGVGMYRLIGKLREWRASRNERRNVTARTLRLREHPGAELNPRVVHSAARRYAERPCVVRRCLDYLIGK